MVGKNGLAEGREARSTYSAGKPSDNALLTAFI